ncbi:hypothetical protein ACRB68_73360 [Actinomadura sp. RB68]|uniref:Transposase n=1 Tax=Actinomadura macrotermitis TaxID=2585200 RepID=A0A7K0C7Y5_9ACTN|nr:hypothetical protein [Actinomadura macrotermitis]
MCIGAQTCQWRAGLQVVAIDMCTVFKAAVRDSLPHVRTWWPQILAAITVPCVLRERVIGQAPPSPDPEIHKEFI